MAGENEGEPIGGIRIPVDLETEQALATLVRFVANAKHQRVQIPIDIGVTGGVGDQIQKAADDAANKFRFAFQTIGKADELQAGLRTVQVQMEQIVATGEKLSLSIGGQTVTLKGKQEVAPFIERFPQYAAAATPGGGPTKLGISGMVEDTDANLHAVAAVGTFTDSTKAATKAQQDAEKQQKRLNEQGEKMAKWLDAFGSGRNPRFGIAEAIRPGLTSALGPEIGSLATGALSILGGAAIFRLGWELTSQLAQIPEKIGAEVAHERRFELLAAAQAGSQIAAMRAGPVSTAMPITGAKLPVSAEAETQRLLEANRAYFSQVGTSEKTGAEAYQANLAGLVTADPQGRISLAKKALYLAQAQVAQITHPTEVTDALKTADAIQRMFIEEGGDYRKTIGDIRPVMDIMAREERKKYPFMTEAKARQKVQENLSAPEWLAPGVRNPAAISHEEVYKAWAEFTQGEQTQKELKQLVGENRWAHARETWLRLWQGSGQISAMDQASVERLQSFQQGNAKAINPGWDLGGELDKRSNALNPYAGRKLSGKDFADFEAKFLDFVNYTEPHWYGDRAVANSLRGMDKNKFESLWGLAGGMTGINPGPFPNAPADKFNPALPGAAEFSFSSLSGFANKMQTEAGVYLDWNKENHGVLEEIRDTLRLRMPSNEREILAHEGIRG